MELCAWRKLFARKSKYMEALVRDRTNCRKRNKPVLGALLSRTPSSMYWMRCTGTATSWFHIDLSVMLSTYGKEKLKYHQFLAKVGDTLLQLNGQIEKESMRLKHSVDLSMSSATSIYT